MQEAKQKNSLSKKRVVIVFLGLLICAGVGWYWYSSTHPLSNRTYGFQYYQPTKLPDGFSFDEKRIDILKPYGKFFGVSADLKFTGVKNWIYILSESTAGSSDQTTVPTKLDNYDPTSVGFTCQPMTSPHNQSYRLCHSIDFGTVNVFWVDFIKGGTYFDTKFPGKIGKTIPVSQLNAYVDSFRPARASGFKILVTNGA